ncbi:MAG: prepilin-type N-terminal cleavage/methylation domain-containing protein [bacterium]
MDTIKRQNGFTVVEAIIVIGVLTILALLLWPILRPRDRHHGQSPCTNNLKQLTTALQIYVQENKGAYPGEKWLLTKSNLGIDVPTPKLLLCPEDKRKVTSDDNSPISYGYSGLLVRPDGTGVTEESIISPYMVVAFAEVESTKTLGAPGIINGSAGHTDNMVKLAYRHNGGTIYGCADGHVKYTLAAPQAQDTSVALNQGLIQAIGLGYTTNYANGITASANVSAPVAACTVSGDYSTKPILGAVAELMNVKADPESKKRIIIGKFTGEYVDSDEDSIIRGIGSNQPDNDAIAIAHDAVVIIRSKNSRDVQRNLTTSQVKNFFGDGQTANTYTYDENSGTRAFFYQKIGLPGNYADTSATIADNDYDMVQKVAGDPKNIGYCSAAFADPNIVDIVSVDGIGFLNPDADVKLEYNMSLWPVQTPTGPYPYMRTLYAQPTETPSAGARDFMEKLPTVLQAVQQGPLFKLSYFR